MFMTSEQEIKASAALNIAAKDHTQRGIIACVATTKWRTERAAVGMRARALDHTEHTKPMVIGVAAITSEE
jgi:hypothetical protein